MPSVRRSFHRRLPLAREARAAAGGVEELPAASWCAAVLEHLLAADERRVDHEDERVDARCRTRRPRPGILWLGRQPASPSAAAPRPPSRGRCPLCSAIGPQVVSSAPRRAPSVGWPSLAHRPIGGNAARCRARPAGCARAPRRCSPCRRRTACRRAPGAAKRDRVVADGWRAASRQGHHGRSALAHESRRAPASAACSAKHAQRRAGCAQLVITHGAQATFLRGLRRLVYREGRDDLPERALAVTCKRAVAPFRLGIVRGDLAGRDRVACRGDTRDPVGNRRRAGSCARQHLGTRSRRAGPRCPPACSTTGKPIA